MGYPTQAHIDSAKAKAVALEASSADLKVKYAAKVTADKAVALATAAATLAATDLHEAGLVSSAPSLSLSNNMANLQAEIDSYARIGGTGSLYPTDNGVLTPASADIQIAYATVVAANMDRLTALLAVKTTADTELAAAQAVQLTANSDWHTAYGQFSSDTGDAQAALNTIHDDDVSS